MTGHRVQTVRTWDYIDTPADTDGTEPGLVDLVEPERIDPGEWTRARGLADM